MGEEPATHRQKWQSGNLRCEASDLRGMVREMLCGQKGRSVKHRKPRCFSQPDIISPKPVDLDRLALPNTLGTFC